MYDFHCHSKHSDGLLSVPELYAKALENGVEMLALTDHDTLSGLSELKDCAAHENKVKIISGIEISTRFKTKDIHIIGLNVDENSEALHALIAQQKEKRQERAKAIANNIEALGIKDAWSKVREIAGHENIARPHFAALLVQEGFVDTLQKAFTKYLARGRKCFVPTLWVTVEEAVQTIVLAGGIAVIAHPLKYDLTNAKLNELIQLFVAHGGQALEVVSGDFDYQKINKMALLCVQYDLYASTGSDFHGDRLSKVDLGRQPSLPMGLKEVWKSFI